MQQHTVPPAPGYRAKPRTGSWVQVERQAHIDWADLVAKKPKAASLLHRLVALMDRQNAVVVSQRILADLMGVHVRTVHRALQDLSEGNWIQIIRIGKGKEAAYVVNDQVAWGDKRSKINTSMFSATVIADAADQDEETLKPRDLKRVSNLYLPKDE